MSPITGVRLLLLALAMFLFPNPSTEGRQSKSRFTNLQCTSYNDSYCVVEKCKLNLLGRGRVGANFYLKMFVLPVDNVWVSEFSKSIYIMYKYLVNVFFQINWSIYRRYNGYQPFLYNVSTDFCHLMKNLDRLSFEGLVINAIMTKSNLNHTCPYNVGIFLRFYEHKHLLFHFL